MGNVVQCCPTFLNYFKCSDALVQGEPERSLLLSSEESECDSPSLPEVTEEELIPSSSNLTLEPENLLFPDIILSSNLGGGVTLAEPVVCLLVSEEEDGTGLGEPGKEVQGRGIPGCYEVEIQTEVEIHNGMGVQTQTEFQGRSKVLMHRNPTVEREENMRAKCRNTNKDICEGNEAMKEVETDSQQHTQPKRNTQVTGFTEKNTDFAQQQTSKYICLGPPVAMETNKRDIAGCVDGSLAERQTADQLKGSEYSRHSKKTGVNDRTGLLEVEEEGLGMRSMALFSLDRLFLTGQHHKSRWISTVSFVVMNQ